MQVVFIGDCAVDHYYTLESPFPQMGGKAFAKSRSILPGGMIANAACYFARYGTQDGGISSYFITSLSKRDSYSPILISHLHSYSLSTEYVQYKDTDKNISALVFIQANGERTIFVTDMPNNDISEHTYTTWTPKESKLIAESSFVYSNISSIQSLVDAQSFWNTVEKNNIPLFFDLDVSTLAHNTQQEQLSHIKKAQIISVNEFGAQSLFGKDIEKDKIANFFEESNLRMIIITKGQEGAEVHTKDNSYKNKSTYIPKLVDTTGAGDCFNATFLYCILQNYSIEKSLELANKAGAYACSFLGGNGKLSFETVLGL